MRQIHIKVQRIDQYAKYEAWSPDEYEEIGGTHHSDTKESVIESVKEYIDNHFKEDIHLVVD